jgi:hypothetical protein
LAPSQEEDPIFEEEGCAGLLGLGDEFDRDVCLEVESDRVGEGGLLSPLDSYSPCSVGEPGHSNWVVQCAKAIYPIVGISCEEHKDAFGPLGILEEERRLEAMAAFSKRDSEVRRELKNLECSVNYNATGECSSL